MTVRRMLTIAALVASAAALAASSALASAPTSASLVIRHQVKGCHAWAVNGGAFKATQKVALRRGGRLTITNNDVMPHTLVQTAGPKAAVKLIRPAMMAMGMHGVIGPNTMGHMGATLKVMFPKAGTYRFTTKAGEDYMSGFETVGEDNVLRLTVTVS